MRGLPDASVDMILCDLPYGTTECKWDSVIPFGPLWEQYKRIAKANAAIVLTATQPFTTALIASNLKDFRYCWVWDKLNGGNFASAHKMPLKTHEDVAVFYARLPTYNPQYWTSKPYKRAAGEKGVAEHLGGTTPAATKHKGIDASDGRRFPTSILECNPVKTITSERGLHPTQKPVALFEYFIRTYTDPGQVVLDNCIGSGTTAIACINSGRSFIGFEKDREIFEVASHRIASCQPVLALGA